MAEQEQTKQVILAIDHGDTNIGLAFGRNGLVNPLKVITGMNDDAAIYEINRYIMENKVSLVLIGLPLSVEGKDTPQSLKVRRFAKLLKIKTKKPVEFISEYRTTEDLKTEDEVMGLKTVKHGKVDHLSAALLLKEYFSKRDN